MSYRYTDELTVELVRLRANGCITTYIVPIHIQTDWSNGSYRLHKYILTIAVEDPVSMAVMLLAPSDGGLQLTSTGAEELDWVAWILRGEEVTVNKKINTNS